MGNLKKNYEMRNLMNKDMRFRKRYLKGIFFKVINA
jgi:hypothetical protein